MQLAGLTTMSVEPIHTGRSKVDIFLELFEAPDGSVVGQIEYDSCLWKGLGFSGTRITWNKNNGGVPMMKRAK